MIVFLVWAECVVCRGRMVVPLESEELRVQGWIVGPSHLQQYPLDVGILRVEDEHPIHSLRDARDELHLGTDSIEHLQLITAPSSG